MFDACITIVGTVATAPAQRDLPTGPLTEFRVVSRSRRYNRQTGRWGDGDELFIKVAAWRNLGKDAFRDITVGDVIIVRGRLCSRRVRGEDGHRYVYEITASNLGHDLARGIDRPSRKAAASDVRPPNTETETDGFDTLIEDIENSARELEPAESVLLGG
ncbi:single-stranded DNA-binding protein [Stackebrandtia soli]|uniref:single-stranded DNA-binding protein n=1 Tax=Stackebrandtia soli TaxID=1892856 RepID=UPI0039E97E87